ncbi:autophagy-related protein [Russula earlei]|uniref:Autophagy-related protein n=1 Tax=Russula earlei TaxID=71964 RepID=A0ACC0UI78_9AGAM|nr:autophagy-related protein [Russula earlei]
MNSTHATVTIDIVLDRQNTREILCALLHAILFHRLFGTIKPQTFEVLDVTMPGVADPAMKRLIEDKVDAFWKGLENVVPKRGEISVTLSKKDQRKAWLGITTYEEEVAWEQWIINAEIRQPKSEQERQQFTKNLASTLSKSLCTMLMHTSSEEGRGAVPPITNSEVSPFPLKISVRVGGVELP